MIYFLISREKLERKEKSFRDEKKWLVPRIFLSLIFLSELQVAHPLIPSHPRVTIALNHFFPFPHRVPGEISHNAISTAEHAAGQLLCFGACLHQSVASAKGDPTSPGGEERPPLSADLNSCQATRWAAGKQQTRVFVSWRGPAIQPAPFFSFLPASTSQPGCRSPPPPRGGPLK